MNAKTLAYEIHRSLRAATDLKITRSHVHELIGAAFGAGSYAAMLAHGPLCQMPLQLTECQPLSAPSVVRRAEALGLAGSALGQISRIVVSSIENAGLRLLSLDLVLVLLLSGQFEMYGSDLVSEPDGVEEDEEGDTQSDEVLELDEAVWRARHHQEETAMDLGGEEVLEALNTVLDRSDARAHLAIALLTIGNFDDQEDLTSQHGRYWYDRQQMGHALVGVEKEWAQDFERRLAAQESAREHLEAAAQMGQPDALLILAREYGDLRFFALDRPRVFADPLDVARIAERLGNPAAAFDWLELAAEHGDLLAMRELIDLLQDDDPLKSWTWFHLAKLHGKDLTQDDYHAIHEDGSPYDDDVGGPMYADGDDGVELPVASEGIQQLASKQAHEIFSRRQVAIN